MIGLGLIILSLFVLIRAADVFVDQASSLAKKFKINDYIIGLTVVAFGTSLPELTSTIFSAIAGHDHLVVSNIIGSNISNLCIIFGILAVFFNYKIKKRDIDLNIPLNFAALLFFWALAVFTGFKLDWSAGVSLLIILLIIVILSKDYNHFSGDKKEYKEYKPLTMLGSLILLVAAGKIGVDQIILLAETFKISETILGYFVLAIGTSLPELVTTWSAAKKNREELGVGNILGSNIFNLLGIMGISSFVTPINLGDFKFDLMFLTGATLAIYIFAIIGKKYSFDKKEGMGLLFIYALFVLFQVIRS